MNPINPPGLFASAQQELINGLKAIHDRVLKRSRVNLAEAVELGQGLSQLAGEIGHGELEKAYFAIGITQRSASDYRRIASLPRPILAKCDSIRDALEFLKPEKPEPSQSSSTPGLYSEEGSGVMETEKTAVSVISNSKGLSHPLTHAAEGPSDEDKIVAKVKRIARQMEEETRAIGNSRKVDEKEIGVGCRMASAWREWALARLGLAEFYADPKEMQCGKCGADVLLVTTTKRNKMYVDREPGGGQFELMGGLAVYVEGVAPEDRKFLYKPHFRSCSKGIGMEGQS